MPASLQIMIGMAPLLVAVIIMFIRKKLRILSTLILFVIGISLFFTIQSPVLSKHSKETKDQTLYLVKSYMEDGEYEASSELINRVVENYGESFETAVCRARLTALQGNMEAAAVLYEKAMLIKKEQKVLPKKEQEFALQLMSGEIVSITKLNQKVALTSYIESVGATPIDYGYEVTVDTLEEMAESIEDGKEEILDSLQDEINASSKMDSIKALEEGIELKDELEVYIDQYAQSGYVDDKEVKKLARDLEEIYTSNPELFTEGLLETSYLEAMVLNQDYDSVVELAEQGNMDALLMTANLYENQKIDEESFSDEFIEDSVEAYEDVVNRCEDILAEYEDEMGDLEDAGTQELREWTVLQEKVATIQQFFDNIALAEVHDLALEKLDQVDQENKSKALIQLAGMNYFLGDTETGDAQFEAALESAPLCEDENYTEPLYNVMEVLSGNETDITLKEAAESAREAYIQANSPVLALDGVGADSFTNAVTNYVSTQTAMINIGNIDTSQFPKIKVNLQFGQTPKNLESVLEVIDAGENIKNIKLTRKEYSKAEIVLVCDMSGSMDGSQDALQSAINQFIDQMTAKEKVSLVGFDDFIQFDTGFTKEKETLYESAKKLIPSNGTNIFGALKYSLETMSADDDASKIAIVMTDGQDNVMPSQEMLDDLKATCAKNNYVVYTIGLGDVYEEYLSDLAYRGNGQFVYCSQAESLKTLYDFIHTQIDNTYELTFEAVNQTDNERVLSITDTQNNCRDSKTYYLHEDTDSDNDAGNPDVSIGEDAAGIAITGVDQRVIYKSDTMEMPMKATGYGFSGLSDVKISLVGAKKTYKDIDGTVVNDQQISFAVPKGAVVDTYTLVVEANNEKYERKDAFSVCKPGTRGTIDFGAYHFAADSVTDTGDGYLLKGNVIMNDFLHFKGDLTLSGDIKGMNITLNDGSGAYVNRTRPLPGVLKYFFSQTVDVPSFGMMTLYNDDMHQYNLDQYKVDSYSLYQLTGLDALLLESASVSLYPNRVEYSGGRFAFNFPGQQIIFNIAKNKNIFKFDVTAACVLNSEALGLIAKTKSEVEEGIKLGTLPIRMKKLEFEIDTLKHDYMIDASVGLGGSFKKLFGDTAFGMKLKWVSGSWDTILVRADHDVNLPTTVPVTLSNFFFGVEEMSKVDQGSSPGKVVLNSYITGGLDIAVAKLGALIKPLKTILGDLSLVTFEETKLRAKLANLSFDLSSKFKLFGEIDMGESQLKIGSFEYENYLLNIKDDDAKGIYSKLKAGIIWDTPNIDINLTGEGEFTLNDAFAGITETGVIGYDINLWFIDESTDLQGNFLAGVHNNGEQFTILIKGADLIDNKSHGVWISVHRGKLVQADFY